MRSMKRWLLVLAVAGLGVAAWFWLRPKSDPAAPRWTTTAVDRGKITAKITATGTISPLRTVQVGSQVSGRILELDADFNTPVTKGQVIARIDPQLIKASVERAQANLSAARADQQRAKALSLDADRQAERARSLAERKLVAQSEADTASSNAEAARAQVIAAGGAIQQAVAALHEAQLNLTYCTIYSPIDGTVISRSVDVGQTVAASFSAPTLFTIAEDLKKMQVDSSVSEGDVGKLQPNMDVTFNVDAFPGKPFKGKVRQIRNAPTTVSNVVTYDAVIDVDNPDLELKPGMTANVTFLVGQKDDALRVPNAALRFKPPADVLAAAEKKRAERRAAGAAGAAGAPTAVASAEGAHGKDGGSATDAGAAGRLGGGGRRWGSGEDAPPDRKTVWTLQNGELVPVRVKIGLSDGSTTEIVEGKLAEGDLVVTDGGGAKASTGGAAAAGNRGGGGGGGGRPRGPF
jgi:HlyD family secretion protein